MTLKEKIANTIRQGLEFDEFTVAEGRAKAVADRILEIPELKEALDLHPGLDRPNLGHSISTGTRKA
jgi:hypothetical protein